MSRSSPPGMTDEREGVRERENGGPPDLRSFLAPFCLDDSTLYRLAYKYVDTFRHLALTSTDQFLPSPVTSLPTGRETGRYLAVYVGQSYLRVAFIELLGDSAEKPSDIIQRARWQRVRRTLEKAWPIEDRLKRDRAEELFSWIGDCIAEVVGDSLSSDVASAVHSIPEELEMGISFCFPIKQESITEAVLMPTGKGFTIKTDLNLRKILLDGYERHTRRADDGLEPSAKRQKLFALPRLKISAMTNDTVATLASLAYSVKSLPNSRVVMGLLVGTGCNATIPMKLADLHESKARHITSYKPDATETVVNTEMTLNGSFPPLNELGIVTRWDEQVNRRAAFPGFQPLEYMSSGRYIGELVRIICHDYMINHLHLTEADLPTALTEEYALTTQFLSLYVAPTRSETVLAGILATKLPPPPTSPWIWTPPLAGVLRTVASTVQTRSAALMAASAIGLLACIREIKLTDPDNLARSRSRSQGQGPAQSQAQPQLQPLTPIPTMRLGNVLNPSAWIPKSTAKPTPIPMPSNWRNNGPEELVVAYSGGVIQHYPNYKETCQRYIDRLVMRGGPQDGAKSVFLREASDGGIIGVGVLAGTVAGAIEGIIGSSYDTSPKTNLSSHTHSKPSPGAHPSPTADHGHRSPIQATTGVNVLADDL